MAGWHPDWSDGWYAPRRPRPARGGIKARSQRGGFARRWWGKRWIEALDRLGLGARLARGRRYARSGQVTELRIAPGEVSARVQGARPQPYRVSLRFKAPSGRAWMRLGRELRKKPALSARVLAGEIPEELEALAMDAGVALLPAHHGELVTDCSCPDWSNPCKHIAAVHYILAEAFDDDPFLLLSLRGLDRKGFLALAGAAPRSDAPEQPPRKRAPVALPADPAAFWGREAPAAGPGEMQAPALEAPLLRRLGPLPLWRGEQPLLEALVPCYRNAAERAAALWDEEQPPPP